jgi:rubrerythrin
VQTTFNDLEALKIAVQIEKRGERFYTLAQSYTQDTAVKAMLQDLAEQEQDHARIFETIYQELQKGMQEFDDTYLYDPEVAAYFRTMVESAVFPNDAAQDKALSGIQQISDVFALGIQAEKDSILFYTEMVIHAMYIEAKEAFRRLIQEERRHLIDLQEKRKQYL